MRSVIYSIGHSSLSIDQFLQLLQHYQIEAIADVRRIPGSTKHPHFKQKQLQEFLQNVKINYFWLGETLGGFRKEGYELFTKTDLFLHGLQQLVNIASQQRTAFLCAEKLFVNCHRRFIADQLASQKWDVIHIVNENFTYPHFPVDSIALDLSKE